MAPSASRSSGRRRGDTTNPVSPLLGNTFVFLGVVALAGAVWAGYSALVVLLGLAVSAVLVTRLWSYLSLKAVECERRLSEKRVFPGDEVTLTLRVANHKILPLPWVEIRDEVPSSLVGSAEAGSLVVSKSTSLMWYSAASFTQDLTPMARGYYALGPLSVSSGDVFGLQPNSRTREEVDHLIVYPRTYSMSELRIPSLSHLGETRSESRVFDDPSRLVGVREYEPGDSPRRIHWKASARSRMFQVKLFEHTTDLKVGIFLAIDSFNGLPDEDFELGVSAAASVARHLVERDVQTGLFANTKSADNGYPVRIAPGAGMANLTAMLESLAKTTAKVESPFLDFFDRERAEMGFGGTLVFVAGEVSAELGLLAGDLARAGRHVLGYHVGSLGQASGRGRAHWRQIERPGAEARAVG